MKWVVCFVLCITIINSAVGEDIFVQSLEKAVNFMKNCETDLALCLKEKALNIVDKLRQSKKVPIIEGVELVGDKSKDGTVYQPLPADADARESEVESRLVNGVTDLMESHRIQLSFGASKEESRALSEARKKKSGMGMIIPLIMMVALKKKMFLMAALMAAKVAFAFKAAVLIAAFLIFYDWGHQKATYEIVTHPHHSHKEHHHLEHHDDLSDHHGTHIALSSDHGIGGGHIGLTSDHGHGAYSVVDDDAHGQAYGGYAAHGGYHHRRK